MGLWRRQRLVSDTPIEPVAVVDPTRARMLLRWQDHGVTRLALATSDGKCDEVTGDGLRTIETPPFPASFVRACLEITGPLPWRIVTPALGWAGSTLVPGGGASDPTFVPPADLQWLSAYGCRHPEHGGDAWRNLLAEAAQHYPQLLAAVGHATASLLISRLPEREFFGTVCHLSGPGAEPLLQLCAAGFGDTQIVRSWRQPEGVALRSLAGLRHLPACLQGFDADRCAPAANAVLSALKRGYITYGGTVAPCRLNVLSTGAPNVAWRAATAPRVIHLHAPTGFDALSPRLLAAAGADAGGLYALLRQSLQDRRRTLQERVAAHAHAARLPHGLDAARSLVVIGARFALEACGLDAAPSAMLADIVVREPAPLSADAERLLRALSASAVADGLAAGTDIASISVTDAQALGAAAQALATVPDVRGVAVAARVAHWRLAARELETYGACRTAGGGATLSPSWLLRALSEPAPRFPLPTLRRHFGPRNSTVVDMYFGMV